MRANARALKWSQLEKSADDPCARQGGAGAALHIGGPSFMVYGGWSVRGMAKDVHILHAVNDGSATAATTFAWTELAVGADPTGCSAQLDNGTLSATYGHTITSVPLEAPGAQAVLICGGVTQGGYR
jgi:hypothetical protein